MTSSCWVPGPGRRRAALRQPGLADDYLELPIQTLKVGSLGTHNTLGLAKAKGARSSWRRPARSTATPQVHPQPETLLGSRQPDRPAGRLRRGQALRRGDDDGLPPHPRRRRPHRADLQHLRRPDAPARRAGGVELPRAGAQGRARSPSTATAARPAASATSTTRSRASWPCSTATIDRPAQHRQPRRVHDAASWPTSCSRSPARAPSSSSRRCRSTIRRQRQPDLTRARAELGWEPQIELREGLERTIRLLPRAWLAGLSATDRLGPRPRRGGRGTSRGCGAGPRRTSSWP